MYDNNVFFIWYGTISKNGHVMNFHNILKIHGIYRLLPGHDPSVNMVNPLKILPPNLVTSLYDKRTLHVTSMGHNHRQAAYDLVPLTQQVVLQMGGNVIVFLSRALCRTNFVSVTHVLVDTWMLTVKPVYKLSNVSDDLKWTTNTNVTPFTFTFKV